MGSDLSSFPTEKHFVSWLRLAPRTAFSAGKPLKEETQLARCHAELERLEDGILDRLVHGAYQLTMNEGSMRKPDGEERRKSADNNAKEPAA